MNMFRAHSLLVIIFFFLIASLSAQEKKEPAQRDAAVPDQNEAPLPKIDLPEFLITGQETIDLPVSSKSIIEEDNAYVPGSPMPGRKDAGSDGEGKLEKDFAGPVGEMNGKVQGGIGNYPSPYMEGWFGK